MLNSKRSATERGNQRLALTKSHRLNLIPFNRAPLAVAVLHSRIPRGTVPSRPASFVRCKSIPASIVYSSRYFRTLNQDQCFFFRDTRQYIKHSFSPGRRSIQSPSRFPSSTLLTLPSSFLYSPHITQCLSCYSSHLDTPQLSRLTFLFNMHFKLLPSLTLAVLAALEVSAQDSGISVSSPLYLIKYESKKDG
jgi:hypothetical protein